MHADHFDETGIADVERLDDLRRAKLRSPERTLERANRDVKRALTAIALERVHYVEVAQQALIRMDAVLAASDQENPHEDDAYARREPAGEVLVDGNDVPRARDEAPRCERRA